MFFFQNCIKRAIGFLKRKKNTVALQSLILKDFF